VDWQRQRFGRTSWQFANGVYERPRLQSVSLDDLDDRDLLGRDLGAGSGDSALGGIPLSQGSSEREIARKLEISAPSVSSLVLELQAELSRLAS
jgi:hypothetical protein